MNFMKACDSLPFARLTYNKVSSMLEHRVASKGQALIEEYADLQPALKNSCTSYTRRLAKPSEGVARFEFARPPKRVIILW